MTELAVESLLALPDHAQQRLWIQAHLAEIDEPFVEALKNQAVQLRMTDVQRALAIAETIGSIAAATRVTRHYGYRLWAEAIVRSLGLGQYNVALQQYDEAIALFRNSGDELSPAIMQVSRIWSLANLNRHQEAFAEGEAAAAVLVEHGRWLPLATLHMNLASVHTRLGEYARALTMYEAAQRSYESFGLDSTGMTGEIESLWALTVHNRAISLCYLGRFDESIAASGISLAVQERLGNRLEAARVRQHLAVTYFIIGRYNESLRLLDQARELFAADGLQRHAARVDLYLCECLLRLRRFDRVIEKTPAVLSAFAAVQAHHEQGIALLYLAVAQSGSGETPTALETLAAARKLFDAEESRVWTAECDIETAQMMLHLGRHTDAVAWAGAAAAQFHDEKLRAREVEALIIAAQAQAQLGNRSAALEQVEAARQVGESRDVPILLFRLHHLLGRLARADDDLAQAFLEYRQAIDAVEQLRSHLMIDLRVRFQEDKQSLYEDIVELCLDLDQPELGLHYADRAKSRTLLEMIDGRVAMRLHARSAADQPLVDRLLDLRARRDQLHRHGENLDTEHERSAVRKFSADEEAQLSKLEKEIAELWDALMIRNADYAEDANLWQAGDRFLDLSLPEDTALVEYFVANDRILVFLVRPGSPLGHDAAHATQHDVEARRLTADLPSVRRTVERLHQHLRTVHLFPRAHLPALTRQVNVLLQQLHAALFEPIADLLRSCSRLIVVPHGALHYVPFHALYDGTKYQVERNEISYLPNAGLMEVLRRRRSHTERRQGSGNPLGAGSCGCGILTVGYSPGNADAKSLPYAIEEADAVANLFRVVPSGARRDVDSQGGCQEVQSLIEEEASGRALAQFALGKQIVHVAAHAEYNGGEPLFSGLLLADGWLTTLDVFNLRLDSALVTLSACQTGRSALGGGDELLGLTRAFLYAGANSLVMTMWSVEDRSTAEFMRRFYRHLQRGHSKVDALAQVQRQFLQGEVDADRDGAPDYRHPYFWAPFFLTGDTTPIAS